VRLEQADRPVIVARPDDETVIVVAWLDAKAVPPASVQQRRLELLLGRRADPSRLDELLQPRVIAGLVLGQHTLGAGRVWGTGNQREEITRRPGRFVRPARDATALSFAWHACLKHVFDSSTDH
jgi:hypothetical protein